MGGPTMQSSVDSLDLTYRGGVASNTRGMSGSQTSPIEPRSHDDTTAVDYVLSCARQNIDEAGQSAHSAIRMVDTLHEEVFIASGARRPRPGALHGGGLRTVGADQSPGR